MLLFLCNCIGIKEYSQTELTERHEIRINKRTKSELWVQSLEWLYGPSGLKSSRTYYRSEEKGKIIANVSSDENISGFFNKEVHFTIDFTIKNGHAEIATSNPRLFGTGLLAPGDGLPINMTAEAERYKTLASRLVISYDRYINKSEPSAEFNNKAKEPDSLIGFAGN